MAGPPPFRECSFKTRARGPSAPWALGLLMLLCIFATHASAAAPVNDDCSSAFRLSGGPGPVTLTKAGTTIGATADVLPMSPASALCFLPGVPVPDTGVGVWYGPFFFNPTSPTTQITMTVTGASGFQTFLRLYDGASSTCGGIIECAKTASSATSVTTLTFTPASQLQGFWLMISGLSTPYGDFTWAITLPAGVSFQGVPYTVAPTSTPTSTPTNLPTPVPTSLPTLAPTYGPLPGDDCPTATTFPPTFVPAGSTGTSYGSTLGAYSADNLPCSTFYASTCAGSLNGAFFGPFWTNSTSSTPHAFFTVSVGASDITGAFFRLFSGTSCSDLQLRGVYPYPTFSPTPQVIQPTFIISSFTYYWVFVSSNAGNAAIGPMLSEITLTVGGSINVFSGYPQTPSPTSTPTSAPTSTPTSAPTSAPTSTPTTKPTFAPTFKITTATPTSMATSLPTSVPTATPTRKPNTAKPTTLKPTKAPVPTGSPTPKPTTVSSYVNAACSCKTVNNSKGITHSNYMACVAAALTQLGLSGADYDAQIAFYDAKTKSTGGTCGAPALTPVPTPTPT